MSKLKPHVPSTNHYPRIMNRVFSNSLLENPLYNLFLFRSKIYFALALLLVAIANAYTPEKDSLCVTAPRLTSVQIKKSFPELDNLDFNSITHFKKVATTAFSFENLQNEFPVPTNRIIDDRNLASTTLDEIESKGNWVDTFKSDNVKSLPIGIKQTINEIEYQLGVHEAVFYKDKTVLTVFGRIKLPQTDETGKPIELFFGANNVTITSEGGITGNANLVLLGDFQIPFNGGSWLLVIKGGADLKTGDVVNKTYISIDCDGVKEMGLEGEVQFSRDMISPTDSEGNIINTPDTYTTASGEKVSIQRRVKGAFKAKASDWNDLIVQITLDPFVLTENPDKFLFTANNATFDFSDIRNESVNFPQYYRDNNLLYPSEAAWRGVYIQSLSVSLPKEFKTKESISNKKRVSFEAVDLLIDKHGISGFFSVENVIPIEEGRTSDSKSWSYSVDKFALSIAANHLVGAEFEGQMVLPISKKRENGNYGVKYAGIISEDEYTLRVSSLDEIDFSVWKAKAQLTPDSSIEFKVEDGKFKPKATLHGRMAISASQTDSLENEGQTDSNNNTIQFKGIEFQDLVLQTESPVFTVGYFKYNDEVKLMNFPVSIANIALTSSDDQAVLGFDLKLNLMDKGFAADTRLELLSEFGEEDFKQRWKFKEVKLRRVYLEADMGAFKMNGDLELLEKDPEYGDGFSAQLAVEIAAMEGITIESKALFGRTLDVGNISGYRYWYFDAMVDNLPTGNSPTGITLKGFGGGAFYHMERRGFSSAFSPSGLSYVPNKKRGVGLKAMVLFGVVNPEAINGGAGFEVLFNSNGGINKMGFYGEGHVMQSFNIPNPAAAVTEKMKEMAQAAGVDDMADNKIVKKFVERAKEDYPAELSGLAGLHAYIGIEHDFENKTLHGEFDMYVNVAGDIIRGRASGGRAGWAVLHLSHEEWYLHMGTPTDRLGLIFDLGVKIEAGGYFMIGDHIPGSPPPPVEVADILGVELESLNYMRDENALKSGKGFAFGQDFSVDTGDIKFLILYARLKAGGGYDIMLKDYGQAECSNTGKVVGINGWYANGQGYAYIQGKVGIKVKLFFKTKKINIFSGGGAVLLQTKAPNPIWMRGYFGGKYSVLGGLIKGRFRFKVSLGKECKFEDASPIDGMKMITDISPKEGAVDADVFTAPQVSFSFAANNDIVVPEDSGNKTYKIILERFVVQEESGKEIVGDIEWNYSQDRATFVSEDILPPNTKLKAIAEVSFQEKINGVYNTIEVNGKKALESKEVNFTTGTAPQSIPLHNIQYCYPIVDQQNYYRQESNTGYIQLKRGQDYLFDDPAWTTSVVYVEESQDTIASKFNYNMANNKVTFPLDKVKREKNYTVRIVSQLANLDKTTTTSSEKTKVKTLNYEDENTVEITENLSETVLKGLDNEIERLSFNFKSSKYNTFQDKVDAIRVNQHQTGRVNSMTIYLVSVVQNDELFELPELIGNSYTDNKALISSVATLDDAYFLQDINPHLYQSYPLYNRYEFSRNTSELGVKPAKAIRLDNFYLESLKYNTNIQFIEKQLPFIYRLPEVYEQDFYDITLKITNDRVSNKISNTDPAMAFMQKHYTFMRKGNYNINLKFNLPGSQMGSQGKHTYKNEIGPR